MRSRTIIVNIHQEPDLYKALMYAMNSNTDYDGWHVSMYQEYRNGEYQRVGGVMLREDVE